MAKALKPDKTGEKHLCDADRLNLLNVAEGVASALFALAETDCAYVVSAGGTGSWGQTLQDDLNASLQTIMTALYGRDVARKIVKAIHKGNSLQAAYWVAIA